MLSAAWRVEVHVYSLKSTGMLPVLIARLKLDTESSDSSALITSAHNMLVHVLMGGKYHSSKFKVQEKKKKKMKNDR